MTYDAEKGFGDKEGFPCAGVCRMTAFGDPDRMPESKLGYVVAD